MVPVVEASAPRATAGADLSPVADAHAGEAEIHYWPCEVLDAFILHMAKRGDPAYAREQLAIARRHQDSELAGLADRLGDYFSAGPVSGSTHTLLRPWPLAS